MDNTKAISKALAVEKTLESLADENKIRRKLNGKQKVYVADQSQFPVVNDTELNTMNEQIKSLTDRLKESQDSNRRLDSELKSFDNAVSTENAKEKYKEMTDECIHIRERLKTIKSTANSVSPHERLKIMQARTKYVKEWRKRKRIDNDILDAILEGYPKSKRELYEEIGIETDEDVNISPPQM